MKVFCNFTLGIVCLLA